MEYKHFTIDEFKCSHCGENHISPEFVARLDGARSYAGVPFKITSGYRCHTHDSNVGGKGNHTTGLAADILCAGSNQRFKVVNALLSAGFNRIGIGETFIHVDCNPEKPPAVVWLY